MGRPVLQFQILSRDPDRACAFYGELFDWTVDSDNPMAYRQIDTGSERGIRGGVWPAPPDGHAMVQLYVEVEDVSAAAERAASLGGQIVIPPQVLPGGDEMAVLVDPEGIAFGVFTDRGGSDRHG